MDKTALRKKFLERRRNVQVQEVAIWSQQLADRLWSIPTISDAEHIMAYLAMPKEANVDMLITKALQQGKYVYVPVCVTKTEMVGVRIQSLEDLDRGALGIRIPKEPYVVVEPQTLDCILVPGLAFDRRGGRMGMGAGYYDRYLQQIAVENRIGIAWDNQISEEMLPMAPHDEWMHTIVTPSESIHCYKEQEGIH